MPVTFLVRRALTARPGGSTGTGSVFGPLVGDHLWPPSAALVDPVGTAGACADSPAGCLASFPFSLPILEAVISAPKSKSPRPRGAAPVAEAPRQQAEATAQLVSLPVQHPHAAGID